MNILVVGSGGREHALAWKLRRSPGVSALFCAPGNPGIAQCAELVALVPDDIAGLIQWAKTHSIDLTVVGPEQPLAMGIVDKFVEAGLAVFGPTRRAAELEWSKVFAKDFMRAHGIPTAGYSTFDAGNMSGALALLETLPHPVVIKADGLAAGKGVVIAATLEDSRRTIREIMEQCIFGAAGARVVIEECMTGEEASVFAVSDGTDYVLLAPAQDHKRVFDGDRGKNTGGMGAYAPAACVTSEVLAQVEREVIVPTLKGMKETGREYRGCLYVGLMLTPDGPKVVEYNCRFGDPETQVILPLYDGDLAALFMASAAGNLASLRKSGKVGGNSGDAACVVLASGGYPDAYEKGKEIHGLDRAAAMPDVMIFHAGTRASEGKIVTSGGRVLAVTAFLHHASLRQAIAAAYRGTEVVSFENMHKRMDIGKRALDRATS